jgi:hypothetical protein
MICPCRRDRFRLVVFFVRIWLAWDLEKAYFPFPVFLNRFAADRFVFILGIVFLLMVLSESNGYNQKVMA